VAILQRQLFTFYPFLDIEGNASPPSSSPVPSEWPSGISGRTGTYREQPRHSEYGLDRFVAAQASSSTGLKVILRVAAGKLSFYE